jgi:predicted nucleic acid-binding protein
MPDLYLLDTNILVHLVRGDRTGEEIKAKYTPFTKDPKPLICAVTEGELRSLSLQFSWGPLKMNKMSFALDYFGRVPIESKDMMEAYAVIDFFSKSQRIKMGKNDVWIASAAYTSGARLATTDDDFDHIAPAFVFVDKIRLA